jgi:hypothetical protein
VSGVFVTGRIAVAAVASAAAFVAVLATPAEAASRAPSVVPVPSLQPQATQAEWLRLVRRRQSLQAPPNCRPLRAIFYAPTDWLRLATKLAADVSPCAQYSISLPPLAGAKTTFRTDQAWRIRAIGPGFHALAEVHMPAWRAWVNQTGKSWYDAGVEARRRMGAAGFDLAAGDGWIVNELSSGVRRDLPDAREEVLAFAHGLYDGDGGPAVKGAVFSIGLSQAGAGPGAVDLSTYKNQLESFQQDETFWQELGRYVGDWSQELYGDVHNFAVPGLSLAGRRDALQEWLEHPLLHARLGYPDTTAAAAFLYGAYSPLANAAWQWDVGSGFGWTAVPAELMQQYVSTQIYALRHFSVLDGQPRDRWGFAWAPHNASGLASAAFGAATAAIQERLAAAIHDSGGPVNAVDPGLEACGAAAVYCGGDTPGSWFNDAWRTFGYWGHLALALSTPPRTSVAGGAGGPLIVRTQLAGNPHPTPSALTVTFSSSSRRAGFSTTRTGPWSSKLAVTIPAGGSSTTAVYYSDAVAGTPKVTVSALGTLSASQSQTVKGGKLLKLAPRRLAIKLWHALKQASGRR